MILLTGFYLDSSAARVAEFAECVRRNSANPSIDQISVFLEDPISPADAKARFDALAHRKVELIPYGRRLTFAHLLEHANRRLAGAVVILANADIYFDESLELLEDHSLTGRCLCLSRWDEAADGGLILVDRPDSQDAWVLAAPTPPIQCDFCLGKPGCDNRFAFEAERAGLEVSNPSRSVRARHLHQSAVRRYTTAERVTGPNRFVPPSFLANGKSIQGQFSPTFPSHRGLQVRRAIAARCREIEATVAPYLGGVIPEALRHELRRAVKIRLPALARPDDTTLATVGFKESMGFTVATLECGASTHNNSDRPLVFVPEALAGIRFTQVVANHSAPVEVEFRTAGLLYVLAAPGWEGYSPAATFLNEAGWREPIEGLRARDGTIFEPWSLVAGAGERLVLPTQVMLAGAELVRYA